MSKNNYILEIDKKISLLEQEADKQSVLLESYNDELSAIMADEDEELIQNSIDRAQERKNDLETVIFDLKLKKSQFETNVDNSNKHFVLTFLSIAFSVVLTLTLIYLTYQQVNMVKDQVILGAVESMYAHKEVSTEVDRLSRICEPLIQKESSNELDKKFADINNNLRQSEKRFELALKRVKDLSSKKLEALKTALKELKAKSD